MQILKNLFLEEGKMEEVNFKSILQGFFKINWLTLRQSLKSKVKVVQISLIVKQLRLKKVIIKLKTLSAGRIF